MASKPLYLSIDVGTGSARVAIFTPNGRKLCHASHAISTRNPKYGHYEQSTDDIWCAVSTCIHNAITGLQPPYCASDILAIGIDATCSLVACSQVSYAPVSISHDSCPAGLVYNVVLWLDRRAVSEAEFINKHHHPAVKQVRDRFGGTISPENEPPKLLWLSSHKPQILQESIFFDLADWIAFRCTTDENVRSTSTLATKWGWGSGDSACGGWSKEFWETLNLQQLCEDNFRRIGRRAVKPGEPVGRISDNVAEELGLSHQCIVASPMVDAHAGSLWALGLGSPEIQKIAPSIEQRLSAIAGTSTCYIQLSRDPILVNGLWGPFWDAVVPRYHVSTAGQSVSGKLLENIVHRHPSYSRLRQRVGKDNVFDTLITITEDLARSSGKDPAEDFHCLDHHAGNRSPLADPSLKGCMIGLTLENGEVDLAVKFRATVQALCCGARSIIETMVAAGHDTRLITLCGGLRKSRFIIIEMADCTGLPVAVSSELDTVLLGGAILARTAHSLVTGVEGDVLSLVDVAEGMTSPGEIIFPNQKRRNYYDRKFEVYCKMREDFQSYRKIMRGTSERRAH